MPAWIVDWQVDGSPNFNQTARIRTCSLMILMVDLLQSQSGGKTGGYFFRVSRDDQLVCIFDHPDLIERCGYWFKPAQKIHGN